MNHHKVIAFEPQKRLLEKARAYVASPERLLEEDDAVSLLIKAFRTADDRLKQGILLLLGSFGGEQAAWPLYQVMSDPSEDEEIRHNASIQLSVAAGFLQDPGPLVERLLEDINSPDPQLRSLAAFALGWEGNDRAAIALVERLYDEDAQVQVTAVNALANLHDDRLLKLLVDRLAHGPLDQKRTILYNLWRFWRHKETVVSIYLDYLTHEDEGLRFDALALLDSVSGPGEHLDKVCGCLGDVDAANPGPGPRSAGKTFR